jgi:hypothetical protein
MDSNEIEGRKGDIMIRPSGGRTPAGRTAARGLATLRVYLMFLDQLVMIFLNMV